MKFPIVRFCGACWLVSTGLSGTEITSYGIDVWADNWFTAYIDGQLLLEDSVSIDTERSFNAETKQFQASLPFVLAFEIKDFKENDTGLEYIGSNRQQIGDGGFITQVTKSGSDNVVAVSNSAMRCMVIHKAPLNSSCVETSTPIAGEGSCLYQVVTAPQSWTLPSFDDSSWQPATQYTADQVRPKGGFEKIQWAPSAKLIWTADLEKDNTILCRLTVSDGSESPVGQGQDPHGDIHSHFSHFENVTSSEDQSFVSIESNGLPEHNMMVGISSWQQQVPLPQNYSGSNSWKIPLNPVLATSPLLTKDHFHKGAIAIAVNGVPIFNALNNRGEYAADIGELDNWGGHSGRADDYHYHLAPEHLEQIVGAGNPIAYALDGFPVYSQTDEHLDEYLGRFNQSGSYQYHATDYPPYLIAGFRGEVQVDSLANAPEDQVTPQPRSTPVRTADYGPLNNARISGFSKTGQSSYNLEYILNGKTHQLSYSWDENGQYQFVLSDAQGKQTVENFSRASASSSGESRKKQKAVAHDNQNSDNKSPKKYCGDGICDGTESQQQCAKDCS
ncbi:YHYH protein [Alginatibacterium sediminis]|uniref:YHYH protein n=1 Tax=Alginatibacterium sediminis TaxID=2164068 RepID=A0A420EH03_9ALTE|nr:YHYH protein [Alginatibacterium sediminis]RKF19969.1 YHYH protein [Alginatibacterium sediminis]